MKKWAWSADGKQKSTIPWHESESFTVLMPQWRRKEVNCFGQYCTLREVLVCWHWHKDPKMCHFHCIQINQYILKFCRKQKSKITLYMSLSIKAKQPTESFPPFSFYGRWMIVKGGKRSIKVIKQIIWAMDNTRIKTWKQQTD